MNNLVSILVISMLIILLWYCFNFNEIEGLMIIEETSNLQPKILSRNRNRLVYKNMCLIQRIKDMEKYIVDLENMKNNTEYKDDEGKCNKLSKD
jgi:hypothetical protein|tara:strand:- start:282 stop:563 length:282 start_codon:yes stop_codon:yes gene_type:complete